MIKKIILLSDGTGNSVSKVWRTNVWRIFDSLALDRPDQVAKYDDGVGSSSFKPIAILGGAFGYGLKRNVLDLYKFLCRNYEPGAKIYAFGFSRGAFTARVLTGLIVNQGLVHADSEADLNRLARNAYRAYRKEKYKAAFYVEWLRNIRDLLSGFRDRLRGRQPYRKSQNREISSIAFLGVWDTVAAYGLPIEEMTHGISQWIWPLEFPDRKLSPKVQRACHALALDDERTTFHPMLWTEEGERKVDKISDERISQIWFVGAHSNVGGGYPDDSLAQIPLVWMMNEAMKCGLVFKKSPKADPDAIRRASSARDKDGRLYDSRAGLGGYYRYGPRKIADLSNSTFSKNIDDNVKITEPKIHCSVVNRLRAGSNRYSPTVIPPVYAVVDDSGRILRGNKNSLESKSLAEKRGTAQEVVWDLIWYRRVVYFLVVITSLYLALFPLIHQTIRAHEFSSPYRLVSETIRLIQNFTPVPRWWPDAYATNPGWLLIGLATLVFFVSLGSRIKTKISDEMRRIWNATPKELTNYRVRTWVYLLRTNTYYRRALLNLKRKVIPLLSVLVVIYVVSGIGSHLIFNATDSMGLYCRESPNARILSPGEQSPPIQFSTNSFCAPTGVIFMEGGLYTVTIRISSFWKDGDIGTNIYGVDFDEVESLSRRTSFTLGVPWRRILLRPWGRVIGRIGSWGVDEYYFDPLPPPAKQLDTELTVTFSARRAGEIFFYLNDAVLSLPKIYDSFYRNNTGTAEIVIVRRR